MVEKICILCGEHFQGNKNSKVCNREHYRKCKVCDKEFKISKTYLNQQTCSKKCANELSKRNREKTTLDRYGVKNAGWTKESQEKIKSHNLEIYGSEYFFQSEEGKSKIRKSLIDKYGVDNPQKSKEIQEKTKKTNEKRYGDKYVLGKNSTKRREIDQSNIEKYGQANIGNLPEYIEKRKEANREKYGFDWPRQNEQVKQKWLNEYKNKTGYDNPFKNPEVLEKIKETIHERYGVEYALQSNEVKEKIKETILEKYGVEWFCMSEECIQTSGHKISSTNKHFGELLTSNNIEFEYEFTLKNRSYDIHILNTNILIEINPTWSHTTEETKLGGVKKEYYCNKLKLAEEYGYRCIMVWDWDDWEKIIQLLIDSSPLYARKCEIKDVNIGELSKFLNSYHLQGNCKGQKINLGLYFENNLIEVMTFGKPRYNKNFEYELMRLCSNPQYHVIGGSEKLFKYFIDKYEPKSVISYCERSKFTGAVYEKLGFKLHDRNIQPSKHWSKNKDHITNNLLLKRGYDQIFGTHYGKGVSNEQLMLENGWLPVFDCGQARFDWRKLDA